METKDFMGESFLGICFWAREYDIMTLPNAQSSSNSIKLK